MIFDSLENAKTYQDLHPNIKTGLQFLENTKNLSDLTVGKHEVDGDNVFALVQEYETKDFNPEMWEAHRKYYDIQFIVKGNEHIKLSRIEDISPNMEYNSEGDYQLFTGEGGAILLKENDFIILKPNDVHQPGVKINQPSPVKKIVVKALI